MRVPDAQLVRRAWQGDPAAFGELVQRHRAAVRRLAARLVGNVEQAEDLTQEAFVQAYVSLGDLREPHRFAAWLMVTTRRLCAGWARNELIRRHLVAERPPLAEPRTATPLEALLREQTVREVRGVVGSLPEPHRTALHRHDLAGERQADIAHDLGVAVGTVKARVHHARRKLREEVRNVSRDWYGELELPEGPRPGMTFEELARTALKHYGLGSFEAIGHVYKPSFSLGIGVQTTKGRYRLWRYQPYLTERHVELEHAMLGHLAERGVPVKRLIPARDGSTWRTVDSRFVAVFDWFSGETPDLRNPMDVTAVAKLHANWANAMADFDPPLDTWRDLASAWRPRKDWAWVLPTDELPLVPKRMGFFAAVRDVESPPPHHDALLAQVRDTEARLKRFAEKAHELDLAELPRGLNHGVFLFGLLDWEPMVTDGNDFVYESRVADVARLVYAIHNREMPEPQIREHALLAIDTYREHIDLSRDEVRAIPLLAWGMMLYYDTFHILQYLGEISGPDRGEHWVCKDTRTWIRTRDRWEERFEDLSRCMANR